ncbi:MAG TPA: Sec-independent protein translocase protein TatB [Xanthobacteraceae bacterium]|nr:Sec-independent protein translocase protein TatB [Xanthobacteraceae bacterium]
MFDISWSEFLLIGVVALIVIGPKELPGVLRTLGQYTRKVRGMAADFQNQFQEAMREAEMADLKKQVDDLAHDVKSFDPLKDVRSDLEATSKDIERSLEATPEPKVEPPLDGGLAVSDAAPAAETAAPVAAVERSELEPANAEAAKTEPAAETAQPDSTERPA